MTLFLKILNGELAGNAVRIKPGLTLGRSKADLVLRDSKISSTHARIEEVSKDVFNIVDLNSTNGLTLNGQKVALISLVKGTTFRIGNIEIEVISSYGTQKKAKSSGKSWQESLYDFVDRNPLVAKQKKIKPFAQALKLEFLGGYQKSTSWLVAYGPRDFGPGHSEFPILEPGAPETCFTIEPLGTDLVIKTNHPDKVLLNGEAKKTEKIQDGLIIEIFKTKIIVNLHS